MKRFVADIYFYLLGIATVYLLIRYGLDVIEVIIYPFVVFFSWLNESDNNQTIFIILLMIVGDLLLCFIYATCKTAFVLTITLSKMLINIGVYWHNLILPTQPYNSFSIKDDVGVTNDDDINNKNSNPQIFILKTGERNVKSK